jgi:hypothetical protein
MLYMLIEGRTLSYGYSNIPIPASVLEFQNLFRSMLVSYIENHSLLERQFLELCVEHIQDISNENFDFMQNSAYKVKE